MSVAKWENLLLARLSGASTALVQAEIVRVIDDFCVRSCSWREIFYGLDVIAGEQTIPLVAITDNAVTVGVINVLLNGGPLGRAGVTDYVYGDAYNPLSYSLLPTRPAAIEFDVEPVETLIGALDVVAWLAPVDPVGEDLPSLLTDMYFDVIFDGVMHNIISVADRPYTDQKAAQFFGARYLTGMNRARVQAKAGFASRAQNWAYPSFGR
jgi:hypothetical protein